MPKSEPTTELSWQGKIRGPDFAPITFQLRPGTTEKLKDAKGRLIWTVTAAPISDDELATLEEASDKKINDMLSFLKKNEWNSIRDTAEKLGWFYANGEPNKSLVQRIVKKLTGQKLIEGQGDHVLLTPKGIKAAERAERRADAF